MPVARLVYEISVLPQANEENDKGLQVPDKSCTIAPDERRLTPILLRVTVMDVVDDNVNLYQTSSSGVPVQDPIGIPELAVAPLTVPLVLVTPKVKTVAPPQSSLLGGGSVPAKTNWKEKIKINNNTAVRAVDGDMVLKGFGRKQ